MKHIKFTTLLLLTLIMSGCNTFKSETTPTPSPSHQVIVPELSMYIFPTNIDPTQKYLFYLHGKIIEDQGIPAISSEYGEYEYLSILETFSRYGFVVISEQRSKGTDGVNYANKVAEQVSALINAGVPAKNITLVGASKGAGITILVSNLLQNEGLNFVILAICASENVEVLVRNQTVLYGNILSIYDASDIYAGSCQKLFDASKDKGLARYDEIILQIGTGHGILYLPLDEWVIPTVQWAGKP